MTGPDGNDPDSTTIHDPAHQSTEHVGILSQGSNVFYDPERSVFFRTEHGSADEHTVVPGSERELDPGETLGEAIETLGEKTGWESLSEWAEEHLESDEG